jgi:hypothetical protein
MNKYNVRDMDKRLDKRRKGSCKRLFRGVDILVVVHWIKNKSYGESRHACR